MYDEREPSPTRESHGTHPEVSTADPSFELNSFAWGLLETTESSDVWSTNIASAHSKSVDPEQRTDVPPDDLTTRPPDDATSARPESRIPRRDLIGPKLPGYVIEGVIGHGGMGVVYKARHIHDPAGARAYYEKPLGAFDRRLKAEPKSVLAQEGAARTHYYLALVDVQSDPDLDAVRSDPGFEAVLSEYKKAASN
jgi:hypothetical protein